MFDVDLFEDDGRLLGCAEAVVDTVFGPAVVDVGSLTGRTRAAFGWGQCHALAAALHRATGWSIVAVGPDECVEDLFCEPTPMGNCGCAFRHLAVVVPGDDDDEAVLLDAFGPRPVSQVADVGEGIIGVGPSDLEWVRRVFFPAADEVADSLVAPLLQEVV